MNRSRYQATGRSTGRVGNLSLVTSNTVNKDIRVEDDAKLNIGGVSFETEEEQVNTIPENNTLLTGGAFIKLENQMLYHNARNEHWHKQCGDVSSEQLKGDYYRAIMSACAYENHASCDEKLLESVGWQDVEKGELGHMEYVIYENEGEVNVAFRGTSGPVDWIANVTGYGRVVSQISMLKIVSNILNRYGCDDLTFAGHSKGGGEALMAMKIARSWGCTADAVVFNERPEDHTEGYYDDSQARSYVVAGEVLDVVRRVVDTALPSRGSGDSADADYLLPPPGYTDDLSLGGMTDRHDISLMVESMKYCKDTGVSVVADGGSW